MHDGTIDWDGIDVESVATKHAGLEGKFKMTWLTPKCLRVPDDNSKRSIELAFDRLLSKKTRVRGPSQERASNPGSSEMA